MRAILLCASKDSDDWECEFCDHFSGRKGTYGEVSAHELTCAKNPDNARPRSASSASEVARARMPFARVAISSAKSSFA